MVDFESTSIGAAVGVATTAITGALVKLLGTKGERSDDRAAATAEWREIADRARHDLDECQKHRESTDQKVDELRSTVSDLAISYATLKAEHEQCPRRIMELESRLSELEHGPKEQV